MATFTDGVKLTALEYGLALTKSVGTIDDSEIILAEKAVISEIRGVQQGVKAEAGSGAVIKILQYWG